jgi:PAS domain S-box-containing protein
MAVRRLGAAITHGERDMLSAIRNPDSRREAAASRKLSRTVQPTTTERFFDKDEIIVSKTDIKGRIAYVNSVFMKIADYEESELLGQPHSLIRHPDMPRAVFKLLWTQIDAGREIFAYVKNMTKHGDYYWVLAHVTPSLGANREVLGYHSNRRVPDPRVVQDTITPLYRALKQIEDGNAERKVGLDNACNRLNAILQEKGIGYDEFILGL